MDDRVPRTSPRRPETRAATSRRSFLAHAARTAGSVVAAALAAPSFAALPPAAPRIAAPWISPRSVLGPAAPSSRIAVAAIGVGGRGMNHVDAFLSYPDTQLVAACDPYRSKRDDAARKADGRQGGPGASGGCLSTPDFREVLARGDLDAVAIASPESWHAIQAAEAVRAGKDVYCEKALSLTVAEGRAVSDAVRRHGRILQVGLQQRSDRNFRFACELARNGYLGKLRRVQVGVPGGRTLPVAPPAPPPADIDYEMWLGPAPWTPYNDLKCTFNWYFVSHYCVGWIQSWGVHHIDIALWGAPALAASTLEVEGTAVFPSAGLADTSLTWRVSARTPDGLVLAFSDESFHPHGCRFEGDEGWVHVVRGGISAEPASLLGVSLRPSDERLQESGDHHRDFLAAIRSRRDPVAPVEAGHAATTLTIVTDIATRLGRKLTWDWKAERFLGGGDGGAGAGIRDGAGAGDGADEANRMLRRSMRSPWSL